MPQPSRRLRLIVPLVVGALALLILILVITGEGGANKTQAKNETASVTPPTETESETSSSSANTPSTHTGDASADTPTDPPASSSEATPATTTAAPTSSPEQPPTPPPSPPAPAPAATTDAADNLHLKQYPVSPDEPMQTLGNLDDPAQWSMQLIFARNGAGIFEIPFSNIWETAASRRQADQYFKAKAAGDTTGYSLPAESERYILAHEQIISWPGPDGTLRERQIPILSANRAIVDGTELDLAIAEHWLQTSPGVFEAVILNDADEPVAQIQRRWILKAGFDIVLEQYFHNLSSKPLTVIWAQYGPPSLVPDRSRYMDRRRFRFGYEYPESFDPQHVADVIAGGDMVLEMTDAADVDRTQFWPNDLSAGEGFTLSWFASTNRYFGLAVHPVLGPDGQGSRSLVPLVSSIGKWVQGNEQDKFILSTLISPEFVVQGGATHDLSIGVFAGPLKRELLENTQPYRALNMRGLILYQMSSFCAICTFQWLADILVVVLAFLDHYVVFDWALAIICLVLIVRTILHPITKRSQAGMQRFTRKMGDLKPQMEKITQKYGDDPKRKQKEQMKLMQEHGVNPLQMLGCLPLFLQMPIWVALYAVLYFAFELRQQPAFWGVFQYFWDWPFLADLSSPDHFFYEFKEPFSFLFWNLTGLNLLPILLGVLFFAQQKYMTPPTTTLSPEQETQQKIMRVMMIVLFPVMLYSAPSGLTLYILTSSSIGIIESRYIRRMVDREVDAASDDPRSVANEPKKTKKSKDPQGRAYAKMLERRKEEARRKKSKTFKKRK